MILGILFDSFNVGVLEYFKLVLNSVYELSLHSTSVFCLVIIYTTFIFYMSRLISLRLLVTWN